MGDHTLGLEVGELRDLATPNPAAMDGTDSDDQEKLRYRHKGRSKLLSVVRGLVTGGVRVVTGIDWIPAKAGSENAKKRVRDISTKNTEDKGTRPVEFEARFDGQSGCIRVDACAPVPSVAFHASS